VFWTRRRKLLLGLGPLAFAAVAAGLTLGCSALLKPPAPSGGTSDSPSRGAGAAGGRRASGKSESQKECPDFSDRNALTNADWSGDFSISSDEAKTLTGALVAALSVQTLSAKLEGEVKAACAGIVRDLGSRGDMEGVEGACAAAVRAINDARTNLGRKARVSVAYVAPHCALPADAITTCLRRCQEETEGGTSPSATRLDCPASASSGVCNAKCTGSCDVAEGMVCEGRCRGGCDWGFRGICEGTCLGTCNGRKSHGICTGRCVGQCDGVVRKGTCRGRCLGPCDLSRSHDCPGVCLGQCSTAFRALQCETVPKDTNSNTACGSSCEIDLAGAAKCTPARITITIDHTPHRARAKRLETAFERHLPTILKIAVGMKAQATAAAHAAQSALQANEDLMSSAASRGPQGAALSTCASSPLRGGLTAIGSLNISVRVAIEVKAATDASDNAGGHHRG
jgi:hypothetical protein